VKRGHGRNEGKGGGRKRGLLTQSFTGGDNPRREKGAVKKRRRIERRRENQTSLEQSLEFHISPGGKAARATTSKTPRGRERLKLKRDGKKPKTFRPR